ncbi:glycosyltransferase family 2 protein [bacterium]|nr:glycosyltransferase family 2 protein [bacterium]
MTNPRISLIVTYSDAQTTIEDCVKSILNQSFKDFELICVNNASMDSSENIVLELTKDLDFVKRISFPVKIEDEEAKSQAIALASGDFICFLDSNKSIDEGVVAELFAKVFSVKNRAQKLISEKMYKREFLENIDIIDSILEKKIQTQTDDLKNIVIGYESYLEKELDKSAKANIENVSNKVYEITCRFNQLEKNLYENSANNNVALDAKIVNLKEENKLNSEQIYTDISKVYEFIASEINKKGCEVNKIYEDITGNYKYTESIVAQTKEELSSNFYSETNNLKEKVENLEKDIVLRYVNIKRLFDLQIDELDSKIKALGIQDVNSYSDALNSVEVSKILDENVEKIYAHINKTNSQFYEELSKIYKELNEKLVSKIEEQQYSFDKKLDEIRTEFNQKIEELKGN